ncbi:AraC family transcriptional regulator, partial [Streptomyces sp. UH6]|nr:AraC family transcriptional regulator [Streptomyces sp. UH6]
MSHIVFFLTPGVHLLDLAAPARVFTTAAGLGLPGTRSPRPR